MDVQAFCLKLPKIELHAHLNGSISAKTMQTLIERKREKAVVSGVVPQHWETTIAKGEQRTMEECFELFRIVHSLVDDADAVRLVAREVVRDFAEDGVVYLELRTTLKAIPSAEMTEEDYLSAVVEGIQEACRDDDTQIHVRLLLSVDRGRDPSHALLTVELAAKWRDAIQGRGPCCQGRVLGVDFSGNPCITAVEPFLPALRRAKELGLKLSLHISEVPGNADTEQLLALLPDRVGHGTFLHPERGGDQKYLDLITDNRIPIELCLTSNVKCKTVDSYQSHHFRYWFKRHLLVLCTDDKGIFSTSLSEEYAIAMVTFQLTMEELVALSKDALEGIFEDSSIRRQLEQYWANFSVQ